MKINYLLCVLMAAFIIGCAVEKEELGETSPEEIEDIIGPVGEQPEENIIIEVPEEKPEPVKEERVENVVYIKDRVFEPANITIYRGETVIWIPDIEKISNDQPRKIACYNGAYRIFMGERLTSKEQKSEFVFEEPGTYLCVEFIYGLRGHVKVKSIPRPPITGNVISTATGSGLISLVIFSIAVFLCVIWWKKYS